MFLMMAEALQFCAVSSALPQSAFWRFLCHQQTHAPWTGCTLHDMIQPSFSFLVGVVLPFSIASRAARGQSRQRMTRHAFVRALALVALGIILRSINAGRVNFTFEDTLTQIGLGYGILFLLAFASPKIQWLAFALILFGYWLAFALYPLPAHAPDFAAHWNKNTNFAWRFDRWFLNLFPRGKPFESNSGGYATLSFIPTLATMILGLRAGNIIRDNRPHGAKVFWFAVAGALGLTLGLVAEKLGICPIVKRIWTPSWVLYSGGWCFFYLAAFYLVVEILDFKRWAFPLVVIGANSIAAYCVANTFDTLFDRLGVEPDSVGIGPYAPLLGGALALSIIWVGLYILYRRKIFIRI